jgi:hypothetical protein
MQRLIAISILISVCVCTGPSQILPERRGASVSQQIVFMNPVGSSRCTVTAKSAIDLYI